MKKAISFLGRGWAFPPEFLRDVDSVVLSAEDENIQQNLHILFSTRCGERTMISGYGTTLQSLLFDTLNATMFAAIQDTIRNAVLFYEPRIKLEDVQVTTDPNQSNRVLIEVSYTIIKSNSRKNFVYPFYLIEGTNLNR